jgi:putative permease
MMDVLKNWYERHFSNPQVVILALLLIVGFTIVIFLGNMLLPLLVSVVIAYLLEGPVSKLEQRGVKRALASIVVFGVFFSIVTISLLVLIPLLSEQITQFIGEMPKMISRIQQALITLPEQHPGLVTPAQINEVMASIGAELGALGQQFLSMSLASLQGMLTWAVYLILITLMVFFFMKDKSKILRWMMRYMPRDRDLVGQVWVEMDQQIGNYIRGKIVEILIIGGVSWVVFMAMGLNYAALLGLLVGLSVLVPFVGATVVTVPVALVAFFQWGWTSEFFYLILAYTIIQALDGNVLVPLIFSEAVNLHPVAIIIAIIVFGGMWGFWGVFFAIPLATLVMAVLNAWPEPSQISDATTNKA